MVPVLSKIKVSTAAICSIAPVFLTYNLFLSKILNTADNVNGELNAKAHGQAMIKTAVNAAHAFSLSPPTIQNTAANKAIEIKTTVKYLLIVPTKVSNFFSDDLKLSLFHSKHTFYLIINLYIDSRTFYDLLYNTYERC